MKLHTVRTYKSAETLKKEDQLAWKLAALASDPVAVEDDVVEMIGNRIIDNAAVAAASVDLVTANISPEAITALAQDLLRVLRPGGALLASGFEAPEIEQVQAVLGNVREVRTKGNWALIAAESNS